MWTAVGNVGDSRVPGRDVVDDDETVMPLEMLWPLDETDDEFELTGATEGGQASRGVEGISAFAGRNEGSDAAYNEWWCECWK
jgi:hypothetical protein